MILLLEILAIGCGLLPLSRFIPARVHARQVSFTCNGSESVPSRLFVVQLPRK